MRLVPMEGNRFHLSAEEAVKACDENTIGVVAILGSTFDGSYEPIQEICDALDTYLEQTGINIPVHVDAASGGFIAPFLDPDVVWDFRLPRVQSINTSGHKYGLVYPGVGWVIWRNPDALPDDLVFNVNYLGGDMPTFALNFSRPGNQIAAQYYNFLRLGRDGYRRVHMASYDTGRFLAQEIVKLGPFELICDSDPAKGIPSVAWKLIDGADPGYTLYDLADRLHVRGWQVPAYPLTGAVADVAVQRILVRQGVSRDLATLLLRDLREAVDHFTDHPVAVPMSSAEASGFSHL
jgi:glutamate decarboxylase